MVDSEASPMLFDDDWDSEPHSDCLEDRDWDLKAVRAEDQRATKYVRPVNQVYVRPVCYRQTGEQRFGHEAKEAIDAFLYEHYLVASTEVGDGYDESGNSADGATLPDGSDEDSLYDDEDDGDYEGEDEDQDMEPDMGTNFNPSFGDDPHVFPRMQRVRNCLTALSQRFNLYFAAYQDKIYVYRPQQPPQILPDESLILRPKRSAVAKKVGGALNRVFGHQVNHLIVGELGDLEVLFFCYDDGDVVAYYTHQIARYILERSGNPHMASPKSFFHSNVGKSAWGLAIHKQSRLLAVTCNKHEVTVFAFSLTDYNDAFNTAEPDEEGQNWGCSSPVPTPELEKHYQSRVRTWHIILCVNEKGRNMPNLAFCDDADGNAEKVVAVDIAGNIWLIDIWKVGSRPVVYPEPKFLSSASRGWGVLILSDSDFKPTGSYCEAFGLPKNQIITTTRQPGRDGIPWWDITCSLFYLRDSAADQYDQLQDSSYSYTYYEYHLKSLPVNQRRPDGSLPWIYPPEDEQDRDDAMRNKTTTRPGRNAVHVHQPSSANHNDDDDYISNNEVSVIEEEDNGKKGTWALFTEYERKEKVHFSRVISPGLGFLSGGNMSPENFKRVLDWDSSRRRETAIYSYNETTAPTHHSKMSIFYTDQCAVELQPLDFMSGPGIRCENVLPNHNHHEGTFSTLPEPWDQNSVNSERISIIRHVRELNLIVCGSLCGRVALVTLTKARRYHADMPFRHGFRVDTVLPRRSDEDKRMRPWAPLHGLAVSPVPDHKARGLDLQRSEHGGRPASTGQMYRLVLHYLDHSILLYHFARSDRDDELLVF